jgi:hypothetical protein
MSTKRAKTEFSVMQAFVDALPNIDDEALMALIGWLEARGNAELKARRARPAPTPAPAPAETPTTECWAARLRVWRAT